MLNKKILLILITLVTAGCNTIHFPKSPSDFRLEAAGTLKFTSNLSLEESYQIVAENTIRCHKGSSSQMTFVGSTPLVFPTGNTTVKGDLNKESGNAVLQIYFGNLAARGLLQLIDFSKITNKETEIIVYRLNDTHKWKSATQSVQNWFDGKDTCFEMTPE